MAHLHLNIAIHPQIKVMICVLYYCRVNAVLQTLQAPDPIGTLEKGLIELRSQQRKMNKVCMGSGAKQRLQKAKADSTGNDKLTAKAVRDCHRAPPGWEERTDGMYPLH